MSRFEELIDLQGRILLRRCSEMVKVPTWQGLDVSDKPQGSTIEVMNATLTAHVNRTIEALENGIKPNLPWAENHFLERVCGKPLNPGKAYKEWPWYVGNVEAHKESGEFSHTYMERYWPKFAQVDLNRFPNYPHDRLFPDAPIAHMRGIRFDYGDLSDVVGLLAREPTTRQAYLPVWFPEDTGAVHKQRVPCSLGYLFLMRNRQLHIVYYIRSCDFYRHLRDDIYLTARLCQWMLSEVQALSAAVRKPSDFSQRYEDPWENVDPGTLTMHIGSLHVFEGDVPRLRREYGETK